MAPVKIKICGLTTPETLEAAIAARAEYVGFMFYPPSPRFAPLELAAQLGRQVQGRIARIGVFVDASDAQIADAVAAAGLDGLQLQGSETPARVAQLRERLGLPVWKAVSVANAQDVADAARYVGTADLILFDAKTPKGALPGGMGLSFDWSLLSGWKDAAPWGLAGGLNADTVTAAIAQTGAPLVDVSSGLESAPGVKDIGKIAAFCAAARAA